eukprot:3246115-Ditylum_brightwellii.AAC.1
MKIHAINPNNTGNQGLVNRHKIRLRRLSGALHFIAKNHLKRASYNSFYPWKGSFLYKDEATAGYLPHLSAPTNSTRPM